MKSELFCIGRLRYLTSKIIVRERHYTAMANLVCYVVDVD